MVDSRRQDFVDDQTNQPDGEDFVVSSPTETRSISPNGVEDASARSSRVPSRSGTGLTERLTDVLVNDGDGDLLLQSSERDDRVVLWLQALDMQVMGACRTDERLKPLLMQNVSNGMIEDRLLAHLSQHFEPAEVGMLARCFCIPLVSICVGKITKHGSLMCPTSTRGNLSLSLLATSDLRLSFIGDNGQTERLFTFSSKSQCSAVSIEEITTDSSGRSFVIRIPDARACYYWCSEKSRLLGNELLRKMMDLIRRKPSISELTGIDESRLGSFAAQVRLYLMGSNDSSSNFRDAHENAQHSSIPSKVTRARHFGSQAPKGSLSPRSTSFKESPPRSVSLRIASRDKLRRRTDNNHLSAVDNIAASHSTAQATILLQTQDETMPESKDKQIASTLAGKLLASAVASDGSHLPPMGPPLFSPYYCWCPPSGQLVASPQPYSASPPELPSLPPLSSLLQAPPLNLSDIPPFLPSGHPLLRLPISSNQQIQTFAPLMCDPIVHIPVIDVCSSGQGYLVSAGPAIPTSIPSLCPNLVNPVLSENNSRVEEGARETLCLLISGSNPKNAPLIDVLAEAEQRQGGGLFVARSRGLYSGTEDVNAIVGGISAMSLFAPPFAPSMFAPPFAPSLFAPPFAPSLFAPSPVGPSVEGWGCRDQDGSSTAEDSGDLTDSDEEDESGSFNGGICEL